MHWDQIGQKVQFLQWTRTCVIVCSSHLQFAVLRNQTDLTTFSAGTCSSTLHCKKVLTECGIHSETVNSCSRWWLSGQNVWFIVCMMSTSSSSNNGMVDTGHVWQKACHFLALIGWLDIHITQNHIMSFSVWSGCAEWRKAKCRWTSCNERKTCAWRESVGIPDIARQHQRIGQVAKIGWRNNWKIKFEWHLHSGLYPLKKKRVQFKF